MGIGFLAGIYPALVLSVIQTCHCFKRKVCNRHTWHTVLRKALVVSQFTISIGLIIATIIVYNQMSFMRNQDLGFSKDQMIVMDTYGDACKDAFKQSLAGLPNVKSVATSSSVPGGGNPGAYSEVENNKGDSMDSKPRSLLCRL